MSHRKTRALAEVRRRGLADGSERMGPGACQCSCCPRRSAVRVWWWDESEDWHTSRTNAWLCDVHADGVVLGWRAPDYGSRDLAGARDHALSLAVPDDCLDIPQ